MVICCLLDIRNVRPARWPHGRAAGRGIPARIEDVGLQAHRTAEDPRHKDRETSACKERRARRDAARHGQRRLIGDPTTSDISSSHKTRARPSGSRPYKTRRFSMCAY